MIQSVSHYFGRILFLYRSEWDHRLSPFLKFEKPNVCQGKLRLLANDFS